MTLITELRREPSQQADKPLTTATLAQYTTAADNNVIAMNEQGPKPVLPSVYPRPEDRVYESENDRIHFETCLEAERIAATLLPEGPRLNLQPITFDKEHGLQGLAVIFTVGTVFGTGKDKVALVPERTIAILQKMNIPWRAVSLD